MAITHSYVDYGAGSDATGDGTIGTPWKTLQKAFDTLTRNTTDGNQVNLKAGTAHVNAAALDLTTFVGGGALASAAPLILRGYTSAANDGGIGEIDCGGASMWAAGTYDFIYLIDLEIHTFGDNQGINLDDCCTLYRCEIHKGASSPSGKYLVYTDDFVRIVNCYIHDPGTNGRCYFDASAPGLLFFGNYINTASDSGAIGAVMSANGSGFVGGNIFRANHTSAIGIDCNATYHNIVGNIFYNSAAGTNQAIDASLCVILNNIIVGWSGAGGEGINTDNQVISGFNAFYNNTANYTVGDQTFIDLTANDVALAADPFTDAANGDFSLTTAAKAALAAKGFPLAYLGAHANTVPNLNIGPIQMAAGGAAGGGFPILGGSVVR